MTIRAETYSIGATGVGTASPATDGTFRPEPGAFNLSLSGTWSATVKLQRAFDDDASPNWLDVTSYTANTETQVAEIEEGVIYRLYCSAYTSGTIAGRLSQ